MDVSEGCLRYQRALVSPFFVLFIAIAIAIFSPTRPARALLLVSGAQATHRNVAMDLSFCFITVLAVGKLHTVVKHLFKLNVTTTKSQSENVSRTIAKGFAIA